MSDVPGPNGAIGCWLFDTHAHLCDPAFDVDRREVLLRAREAGLRAVIAVGETLEDAQANLALAREFPTLVRVAAGLFPTVLEIAQADLLEQWIRRHATELIAIGEVGLDYWKVADGPGREIQREIFARFVDLSLELDLPLNVHSRSAGAATIELLLEKGARRVQLHAFDGRAARAQPAVEAGFYFSIPPSVVRSRQKQKLVRQLPLESLLLETDSPVLARQPGERNEPAHLLVALQAVAELKGLPRLAVAEAIAESSLRLYGEELLGSTAASGGRTSG
jgi:TatD DNase family protein